LVAVVLVAVNQVQPTTQMALQVLLTQVVVAALLVALTLTLAVLAVQES
jgi:hypothetical protein